MINHLSIKNFKSIKHLQMPCKKLNVFIGEPNSGKSNIIEALALQSQNSLSSELNRDIFRYKTMGDIFYDSNINLPIEVVTDQKSSTLFYSIREDNTPDNQFHFLLNRYDVSEKNNPTMIGHDGRIINYGKNGKTDVRYYEYKRLSGFSQDSVPHLSVPFGKNLPGLLLSNAAYNDWVSEFFQTKDLTLTLKPTENDLALSKLIGNRIYSYPYFTVSETLQRVVFCTMAIISNANSVLLFDEPETNTFPFYTKILAERIALDETNQFFITTHNPYLLLSLIEKSKFNNLNVCIVQMKDYETNVKVLNEKQVSQVLDFNSDVFFNFDKILDK
jgi:AAA15 family ATPase/GTPase